MPSMLEILEAHRPLANAPDDTVCACDRTWRPNADYRAHVAKFLDEAMREAKAEAWDEGHKAGWNDRNEDEKIGYYGAYNVDTPNPYRA